MKTLIVTCATILALVLSGCTAGFYLVGAEMHNGDVPKAIAKYRVMTCASVATGVEVTAPTNQVYFLEAGPKGLALYEIAPNGQGAKITNHWSADNADHFFTYVKTNAAWHYVIPKDPAKPAMRYAFDATGNWDTVTEGTVIKPTGKPGYKCPMDKIKE